MKGIITLKVEDGLSTGAKIKAFSKDTATIFITADNMQDAFTRLTAAQEEAQEACDRWTPEEEKPEEPQKHYKVRGTATEDIDEYIESFKNSKKGQRFLKELENAKAFRAKKDGGSIRISQFLYILALTYKEEYSGLLTMCDYAYRKGYNKAVKDRKARTA